MASMSQTTITTVTGGSSSLKTFAYGTIVAWTDIVHVGISDIHANSADGVISWWRRRASTTVTVLAEVAITVRFWSGGRSLGISFGKSQSRTSSRSWRSLSQFRLEAQSTIRHISSTHLRRRRARCQWLCACGPGESVSVSGSG